MCSLGLDSVIYDFDYISFQFTSCSVSAVLSLYSFGLGPELYKNRILPNKHKNKKSDLQEEVTEKSRSPCGDDSVVVNSLEDSVVEESYVLLDFPEFHSTTIFNDSKFELLSEDKEQGSLFKISNCSFDTIRLNKFDTEKPSCVINEYLPLNGSNILNGMTYILVNKDQLNGETGSNKGLKGQIEDNSDVWYTSKCIEFSTDQ